LKTSVESMGFLR